MPGLVVFNRKWSLGSDDLVFFGLFEIAIRTTWLVVLSVFFHKYTDTDQCHFDTMKKYLIGEIVILTTTSFLTIMMVVISSRGSITNVRPRRHIPTLIYIRCSLGLIEITWTVIGTYWSYQRLCLDASIIVMSTVRVAVVFTWVFLALFIIAVMFVFDPLGKNKMLLSTGRESDIEELWKQSRLASRKIWENRFKFLCCCVGKDDQRQTAFREVAELLSSFFMDVDLVPSDLAAGMILLQMEQEKNRITAVKEPLELNIAPEIPLAKPLAWMTLGSAAHFLKFAMGSYGWLLYIWTNSPLGFCRICPYIRCCSCFRSSSLVAINDNCCGCHTAALKQVTGLTDEDLIYVSFHNRIFEVPFYVALDHRTQSVIVSIRASLSLADALTDMSACCDIINVPLENGQEKLSAHKGILRAAVYIKNKLLKEKILDHAFTGYEHYTLVLTGHSLGAGTAAILAVILKQYYPTLKCFAYSPPGGLMSAEASVYSRDFICTVIRGDDLVTRMSMQSLDLLKKNLIRVIQNCQIPKYRILVRGLFRVLFGKLQRLPSSPDSPANLTCPLLGAASTSHGANNSISATLADVAKRLSTNSQEVSAAQASLVFGHSIFTYTPLYLPGQILHLQVAAPREDISTQQFQAIWSHPNSFQEILVSQTMMADHFPDAIMDALLAIMNTDSNILKEITIRTEQLPHNVI